MANEVTIIMHNTVGKETWAVKTESTTAMLCVSVPSCSFFIVSAEKEGEIENYLPKLN